MRMKCQGSEHLNSLIKRVIDFGGEGMIMRKVNSLYENGRSNFLVKLKTSYGDKEALVVGVNNQSLSLKLPNGQVFEVPQERVYVQEGVAVGQVVSFSHSSSSRRASPVLPEVFRVRHDLDWPDVVFLSVKDDLFERGRERERPSDHFTAQPRGYWTPENMRSFMIHFAKKLNLDPLLPFTWHSIPLKTIYNSKGGRSILRKFRNPQTALQSIFPDIGLKKFQNHWNVAKNRRKFFEAYAKENGFDCKSAAAWYMQPRDKILSVTGAKNVLQHHNNNLVKALISLFPDIEFDSSKFVSSKSWSQQAKRRLFFERYARANSFDPLKAENWYLQSKNKIKATKGGAAVVSYHNGLVSQALLDLFPDIGLDRSRLLNHSKWHAKENRRAFFEEYAKENGFDPLIPNHWYSQPKENILSTKGGARVVQFHDNSIAKALIALFPETQFDKAMFGKWAHYPANRRKFFGRYAEQKGFDPLHANSWYSQSADEVKLVEGGATVLSYYDNNLSQALISTFPDIGLERAQFKARVEWNNRREFFVNYAKENGFDPLSPSNWYDPTLKDKILSNKDVKRVIYYHNENLSQALLDLFPDIGLQQHKFYLWGLHTSANRRKFFVDYALQNGFDAEIPDNWYNQPKERIMSAQGASVVLSYHKGMLSHALSDLFPSIGLDKTKLNQRSKWRFVENRRKFFEDYAHNNNFDPTEAESWYKQSKNSIIATKGIMNILAPYNHSLSKALLDSFPDIDLDISKFPWTTRSWNYTSNRKKFFDTFAKENGFDASDPENWYQQSPSNIMKVPGAVEVMAYHKKQISQALLDLFPNIGLDEYRLWHTFPKLPPRRKSGIVTSIM